jgi:Nucleotidyltransferase domain
MRDYASSALCAGHRARDAGDPLAAEIRCALTGPSLALMLYGSRARGDARPDSDVDILQLVPARPRSYSTGRVNITAYTPAHLMLLAQSGSLFVRHLRDEGIVLQDVDGLLDGVLAAYQQPNGYERLKSELAVALAAACVSDADSFAAGLLRLASYAARSALYVQAAESGRLTFDTEQASSDCGVPELPNLLRSGRKEDTRLLAAIGLQLIRMPVPPDMPTDLPSLAVWSRDSFPLAAGLLEAVVAGAAHVDYTALTLPPV